MDRSISRRSRRRIPPGMETLEGRTLLSALSQLPEAGDPPVQAITSPSSATPPDDQTVHLLSAPADGTPSETTPAYLLAASSGLAATNDQTASLPPASSKELPVDDQAVHLLAASTSVTPGDEQDVRLLAASSGGSTSADPPVHLISAESDRIELDGTVRGKVRPWQGATIGAQPGFALSGVGQHATVGRARVDGFLMPTSVESNASATLTLKTARGNLTLALEALPETSARPALAYRYTLQKGTGTYRNATATGSATLSLPQGLPRAGTRAVSFSVLLQSDRTRR